MEQEPDEEIELELPEPGEWLNQGSSPDLEPEDWFSLSRREKALHVLDLCMSSRATLYIRLQAAKLALELEKSKEKEDDPMDSELRKLITQLEAERVKK